MAHTSVFYILDIDLWGENPVVVRDFLTFHRFVSVCHYMDSEVTT